MKNMALIPDSQPFKKNYTIILKELVAASIAGLVLSFAIIALWLLISPSLLLVLLLLAIMGGGILVSYWGLRLVLNPPRSSVRHSPAAFGISKWEDVRFRTSDGIEIGAWLIPPALESDGATVIFVHGMSANRGELVPEAAMLVKHGYGALLIDLRNHGRSSKALTTFGYREVEDVRGAVNFLLAHPKVNPERIGVFGYSLGGATALCATARIPQIRAVLAQSTFTSLEENIEAGMVAQLGLPPFPFAPLLIWLGEHTSGLRVNQVRPIDDVAKISPRAVMFIHGKRDSNIAADNSRRLYTAAFEPKLLYLVDNIDHKMSMSTNSQEYEHKVISFFDRYLCNKRASNTVSTTL